MTRSGARAGWSGAMPGMPSEPLDRKVFGELVDLETDAPGFLADIVAEFRTGTVERMAEMRQAVRAGDAKRLSYAAHALRGSCATLGAGRMARLAAHAEESAPNREHGLALIERLEAEFDAYRRALDDVLIGLRAA